MTYVRTGISPGRSRRGVTSCGGGGNADGSLVPFLLVKTAEAMGPDGK